MDEIRAKIRAFRDERDWKQFHNPKDMAIAISIEASELLENFLWKPPDELDERVIEKRESIEDEIADIAIYLVELADNLDIDLLDVIEKKIEKNESKYPASLVKGSSKKYTEYSDKESDGE